MGTLIRLLIIFLPVAASCQPLYSNKLIHWIVADSVRGVADGGSLSRWEDQISPVPRLAYWHLYHVAIASNFYRVRVDTVIYYSSSSAFTISFSNMRKLGESFQSTYNFDGDIAEMRIYSNRLSDARRDSLQRFLDYKYSLRYSTTQLTSDISSTSLIHWVCADSISGNDGDAVTTWADESGTAAKNWTQSTAGLKPILKKNIVNGHAVVRFDGDDDVLTMSDTITETDLEVYIVVKPDADPPATTGAAGFWDMSAATTSSHNTHHPYTDGNIYESWGRSASRVSVINSKDWAAGTAPTYRTNQVNGHAIVDFDGTDDVLNMSDTITESDIEVYIVSKSDADPAAAVGSAGFWNMAAPNGGEDQVYHPYTDGIIYEGWGRLGNRITVGNMDSSLTSYRLYSVHVGTDYYAVRFNGSIVYLSTSAFTPDFSGAEGRKLGDSWQTGVSNFAGNIAEMRLYSPKLDDSERAVLHEYFRTTYGVTILDSSIIRRRGQARLRAVLQAQ